MRREAGFSLIEMMIALTIIGLATSLAVLGSSNGPSLSAETDRFIAAVSAARDRALIENRTVVMDVSEVGYSATVRRRLGPPAEIADIVAWEKETSVVAADGRSRLTLMFDPVGLTEPAEIVLFRRDQSERVMIDGAGEIGRASNAS